MTIYFTSDTHYGHKNIIKYSKRPFADENEMDEALIKNWNARVRPQDTIYHLGDVAFRNVQGTCAVLNRLNGRKHLLLGNHDQVVRDNAVVQTHFETIRYYHELKHDGMLFVLCHYPMITWNRAHRGSFMLHGHCHGSLRYPFPARIMDVGVDPQGYRPISIDEVVEKLSGAEFAAVDHHLAD